MKPRLLSAVTAAALLAGGAGDAPAQAEPRAALERRIALTSQLLGDSATAQRIAASHSAQAMSHLDEGRQHHALALEALERGDLAAARSAADDALRHIALARRMVPDTPSRQAAVRQRHAQMLANLERLLDAWRVRLPAMPDGDDGDRLAAIDLVATARWFAAQGLHEQGVHALRAAEGHVLAGMNRMLQQQSTREIDYTERIGTPDEEFRLELRRHLALADLVPLAVAELKPRPEATALITRYDQASRALRAQAVQLQQAGDTAQALANLRNATLYLQRALGAAGVATPAGDSP